MVSIPRFHFTDFLLPQGLDLSRTHPIPASMEGRRTHTGRARIPLPSRSLRQLPGLHHEHARARGAILDRVCPRRLRRHDFRGARQELVRSLPGRPARHSVVCRLQGGAQDQDQAHQGYRHRQWTARDESAGDSGGGEGHSGHLALVEEAL